MDPTDGTLLETTPPNGEYNVPTKNDATKRTVTATDTMTAFLPTKAHHRSIDPCGIKRLGFGTNCPLNRTTSMHAIAARVLCALA